VPYAIVEDVAANCESYVRFAVGVAYAAGPDGGD
jgi:hypothetical protein